MFQKKVEELYNKRIKEFSEQHILGCFIIGKANYENKKENSKIITVYVPDFKDLCFDIKNFPDSKGILDVRKIYSIYQDNCLNCLELLFTDYFIINPLYEEIFYKYFYNNREIIARSNQYGRIKKAYTIGTEAYFNKNYYEAYRLLEASKIYMNENNSVYKCFHYEDPINWYLNSIYKLDKDYNKYKEDFEYILYNLKDKSISSLGEDYIKNGIIKIIEKSLLLSVDENDFKKKLSKKELKLFEYIKNNLIDNKITINASKLIEEFGVSTPVIRNLFSKMDREKIAEIKSHGAKGTEIIFKI